MQPQFLKDCLMSGLAQRWALSTYHIDDLMLYDSFSEHMETMFM